MATNTTTPAEELAALVLQRAHESLDVEEGVPGAAARLAAIEDRIREVNATVERQALAEQERGRRAAEAQERERERQRQDEQSKIAKLDAALPRALADVETAFQSGVVAIKKALALSGDRAVAQSRLRTLDGDERMHAPDGTASAITDRATHLLNREAGLSDVRSSSSYGLGEKPLGAK